MKQRKPTTHQIDNVTMQKINNSQTLEPSVPTVNPNGLFKKKNCKDTLNLLSRFGVGSEWY